MNELDEPFLCFVRARLACDDSPAKFARVSMNRNEEAHQSLLDIKVFEFNLQLKLVVIKEVALPSKLE